MSATGFRRSEPTEFLKYVVRTKGQNTDIMIHFNGVNFFNQKDKIDISKITQHLTLIRRTAYRIPEFVFNEASGSITSLYFLIHCKLELKHSFYEKATRRDAWFNVKSSMQLLGIGKSTLLFHMTIMDMSDDEILGSTLIKMAKVDSITRRSSHFSDSFLAKYAQFAKIGTSKLPPFKLTKAPDNSFNHQFVIRPSDTDANGHTSNSIYAMLCLDCADMAASKHDFFKRFSGDFEKPRLVERYFAKECGEGDTVNAVVWEDGHSTTMLHFQLFKDSVLLFQADIDFYPRDNILSKL